MNKKIDYSKLEEITIKSQNELDEIPLNFKGRIYIKFGDYWNPAVIKNRYYHAVEAYNNSTVEACDNSTVKAYNNSTVEAYGNVQVLDTQYNGKINISGNSRIVYMPRDINEFIAFYNIKHTKTTAIFYKAVRKDANGVYRADKDSRFIYEIGKYKIEQCDLNTEEDCSYGIHISTLNWALNYGDRWNNLAILELKTKISDIVLPKNSNGKVRTSKVKVLREVPLEECKIYGKILAKRR